MLAHFCVVCEDACLFGLGVLGLCGFIGKVLLFRDCLCGLVVRVSGYRYRGPGFDPRRYQIF